MQAAPFSFGASGATIPLRHEWAAGHVGTSPGSLITWAGPDGTQRRAPLQIRSSNWPKAGTGSGLLGRVIWQEGEIGKLRQALQHTAQHLQGADRVAQVGQLQR